MHGVRLNKSDELAALVANGFGQLISTLAEGVWGANAPRKLFETAEERTVPVRYEPSFGPEALVKATPLPDVIEPIVFDPEQEEAEEEAEVGARPEGPGLVPGSQVKRVAVSSARGGTELL